jgi:hypothetical protein
MRRQLGSGLLALVLPACGPWIIEQPTQPPSSPTASVAPDQEARRGVAEMFDVDPSALVATEDGFVFVARLGDELHLLLSREGATENVEVLARVVDDLPPDASGGSSFAVVCPAGSLGVRYYLFGQDTREVTRVTRGLSGIGGEVIDGLWLLAITDDEIAPEQRWEVVDPLGIGGFQSGSGELFVADGETFGEGDSLLCEVN